MRTERQVFAQLRRKKAMAGRAQVRGSVRGPRQEGVRFGVWQRLARQVEAPLCESRGCHWKQEGRGKCIQQTPSSQGILTSVF